MRRFLAIALSILCIALPLQVGAGVAVKSQHCPHMQDMPPMQLMQEQNAPSPADSSFGHNCCNDAATAAKTGQLCKTGHECSPSLTYVLSPSPLHLAITIEHTPLPVLSTQIHASPLRAVWRPPTPI
jgi:hypothetical protein